MMSSDSVDRSASALSFSSRFSNVAIREGGVEMAIELEDMAVVIYSFLWAIRRRACIYRLEEGIFQGLSRSELCVYSPSNIWTTQE